MPSNHSNSKTTARTQSIQVNSGDLDGGGGIRLRGLEGVVRVTGKDLRALDVEASPRLEALDLSECRDDLRLHLVELPNLKWVHLPAGSTGATIELALPSGYAPIAPLAIRGPIADFGLCAPWLVQPWRLDRPLGKRPVDGLAIGPPSSNPPCRGVAAHLVLGRACRGDKLTMDCRGVSHLLVMGARIQELELRNASLERLHISECPQLERIGGRFQAHTARIVLCKQLRAVGGSGQSLEVAVIHSPRLALEGRWLETRIVLADCRGLELHQSTRLKLKSLPMLVEIESEAEYEPSFDAGMFGPNQLAAELANAPGELTRLFERETPKFGDRSRLSTHWIRHLATGDHGRHVPGTLSALREIAANGIDREACWLIRCQLAAQRRRPHAESAIRPDHAFRLGSSVWDWDLFAESGDQHWLDDLQLYRLCADLEVTAPFRRTLGRLDRLHHAAMLARTLAHPGGPGRSSGVIGDCLRACLARLDLAKEWSKPGQPRGSRWMARLAMHRGRRFNDDLGVLIESLGKVRDPESSARLAARLTRIGDATAMQDAAFSMHRAGLGTWQQVLVAGIDAPGEVSAQTHERSLRLLLSGELESARP